jgi:transposase
VAAPGGFPPLQRTQIVRLACTSPAEASRAWVRWSVQALHVEIERRHIAELHPSTVHRILQDAALHPHHIRYWRHSFDPAFEAKAASVLWYYERVFWLAQRDELVVCLDEKTQIQALRRPVPDLPMQPGRALRREWEYKRDGTMNLLVAYTPITGTLWGRMLLKNDHEHFIEAVEAHLAQLPRDLRRVHYIMDNGSSHIAADTRAWLETQKGRVVFHFTPAHASWLNQAELALSAFSRRYLRDRVSTNREELVVHIHRALAEYNLLHARPFDWSFTRHALHDWYARKTLEMVH